MNYIILFLGFFNCVLNIVFVGKPTQERIFFSLYFLILSLVFYQCFTLYFGEKISEYLFIFPTFRFSHWLLAPLCYLYIKSIFVTHKIHKKEILLHVIPAILIIINFIPFYIKSYDYKVDFFKSIILDASKYSDINTFISPKILFPLFIIFNLIYVFRVALLWNNFNNSQSNVKKLIQLKWIKVFTLINTLLFLTLFINGLWYLKDPSFISNTNTLKSTLGFIWISLFGSINIFSFFFSKYFIRNEREGYSIFKI